jgi:dTDP-4-amino-4,6-dideoxygalactose transaminase
MQGDTVSDFSSIVGLELDTEMQMTRFNANPSLSPLEAEMCRLINIVSKQKEVSRNAILDLLRNDQTIEHDQYHFMDEAQRVYIMEFFEEGNAAVAQRFFQKSECGLFSSETRKHDCKKIVNFH